MASPDLPPPPVTHKDDEQFPGRGNGETTKSTPPDSGNDSETPNKRKRDLTDAGISDNEEKISPVVDTTDTVATAGIKEVEMKDAEAINESPGQGIKEVEMQDAEAVYDRTNVEENSSGDGVSDSDVHEESKTHPWLYLNATEGVKQDAGTEQPIKVEESERNEKRSIDADGVDGSGPEALGEVATLLKQVQQSDSKAKLEVEVKVKKMDDGAVKENGETETARTEAQVSCP
ncbi:hypothetical protein LXL04_009157 [Taraxacum kok-saghyz]